MCYGLIEDRIMGLVKTRRLVAMRQRVIPQEWATVLSGEGECAIMKAWFLEVGES